jgi:predicted PurR-regulated permease PerM
MTVERKASYFIFALLAFSIVLFQLGAALLAGIIAFLILDFTDSLLKRWLGKMLARAAALIVFIVAATLFFWVLADFVRMAVLRTPMIIASLIPKLKSMADQWGVSLPFDNLDDLRFLIAGSIKNNVHQLTRASSLLTQGFLRIMLAVFSAVACFWSRGNSASGKNSDFSIALGEELSRRMALFMNGFKKAFGAQFTVSLINTGFISFLLLILGIPYIRFLVTTTFILGLVPVVGGVVTNTLILAVALTVSSKTALVAFIVLMVIHHIQYPIQGEVMGEQMKIPAWQLLLALILGEAVMGVAGMVLAPAAIHYLREEIKTVAKS